MTNKVMLKSLEDECIRILKIRNQLGKKYNDALDAWENDLADCIDRRLKKVETDFVYACARYFDCLSKEED